MSMANDRKRATNSSMAMTGVGYYRTVALAFLSPFQRLLSGV